MSTANKRSFKEGQQCFTLIYFQAKLDKQEYKDVTTISGQIDSEDVTPVVYGAFEDTEMGTSFEM